MNAPTPTLAYLERRLRRALVGEAGFDAASIARHATDRSPWRIEPIGVVWPAHESDVIATLEVAARAGVAVVPRGSGTGNGGESLPQRPGAALVIDASRHLKSIIDFDPRARRVVVQPGLTLAELNRFLAPHGLWLPIEGPGDAQATLGGLVACDTIGARTIGAGRIDGHLDWIAGLLADGTRQRFGPFGVEGGVSLASGRASALVSALFERAGREADALRARRPGAQGAVGGYRLDALVDGQSPGRSPNLAHLLAGSRGSLCWFERIALRLSPIPAHRRLVALPLVDARMAMRCMSAFAGLAPAAAFLLENGSLMLEFQGDNAAALAEVVDAARDLVRARPRWVSEEPHAIDAQWRTQCPIRSALDVWSIPLGALDDYVAQVEDACTALGLLARWSGAVGSGAAGLRIEAREAGTAPADHRDRCAVLAARAAAIASNLGGSPASEHGDDRLRAQAIERVHGRSALASFLAVKQLFDPHNRLNPGKVVGLAPRIGDREPARS